jgi:hypothetical protein
LSVSEGGRPCREGEGGGGEGERGGGRKVTSPLDLVFVTCVTLLRFGGGGVQGVRWEEDIEGGRVFVTGMSEGEREREFIRRTLHSKEGWGALKGG